VGSEMCIRDRLRYRAAFGLHHFQQPLRHDLRHNFFGWFLNDACLTIRVDHWTQPRIYYGPAKPLSSENVSIAEQADNVPINEVEFA